MGALAVTTSRVRLGQMCTCNAYRPPSYLAKVAATVDVLSGGRLEMGIGAGWFEAEFLAYGHEFPKPSVRIGQLREAVEIMRRMWTEDEVHFQGEYYTLAGAICQPKPVQQPHIPFWIAGGGEKLTLRLAAQSASYTNFGDDLEDFQRRSQILADHCRDVGRNFDEIVRSSNFNMVCAETEAEVKERLAWLRSHYAEVLPEQLVDRAIRNHADWAGTPDQVIEKLRPWKDAGLGYLICYVADAAYDRSGLEMIGREIAPAL
jgi:alkanesulfonate monooxygenase SsuD/methylene tetrahydromethanopterin reductase-like flavin-dependent oxidoreductase (luciferase family)